MNDVEAMKYVIAKTGFECAAATGGEPHLLVKLAANNIRHFHGDTWEAAAEEAVRVLPLDALPGPGTRQLTHETVKIGKGKPNYIQRNQGMNRRQRRAHLAQMRKAENVPTGD